MSATQQTAPNDWRTAGLARLKAIAATLKDAVPKVAWFQKIKSDESRIIEQYRTTVAYVERNRASLLANGKDPDRMMSEATAQRDGFLSRLEADKSEAAAAIEGPHGKFCVELETVLAERAAEWRYDRQRLLSALGEIEAVCARYGSEADSEMVVFVRNFFAEANTLNCRLPGPRPSLDAVSVPPMLTNRRDFWKWLGGVTEEERLRLGIENVSQYGLIAQIKRALGA